MSDYKKLASDLRIHAEYCDMPFSWMNDAYADAAAAIEALVRENEALKQAAEKGVEYKPVRHGYWIEENGIQICSECGEEHEWDEYRAPFCETCGAKMDGESEKSERG